MTKKTIRSKDDNKLFPYLGDYLNEYLPEQRNLSPNTVDTYRTAIVLFLRFLSGLSGKRLDFLSFADIGRESLASFSGFLLKEKGLSAKTINLYVSTVRRFVFYASTRSTLLVCTYHELTLVPMKKVPQDQTVKSFTKTALEAILAAPRPETSRTEHRDQVAMIVLYDTGCRNSELTAIRIGDVFLDPSSPHILLRGKGDKPRMVPITPETANHLKAYIRRFHKRSVLNDCLFYRRGTEDSPCGISKQAVINFVRKYGDFARKSCPDVPEDVHPHMFRHSRAMHLLDGGMPLTEIAHLFGHNDTSTTQIYAEASLELKRKAIEKASAIGNPLKQQKVAKESVYAEEEFLKRFGI